MRIKNAFGTSYTSIAEDNIYSKSMSSQDQATKLEQFKLKAKNETQGLMTEIQFKINVRYMITKNIYVSDGLANGTSGILKQITFERIHA